MYAYLSNSTSYITHFQHDTDNITRSAQPPLITAPTTTTHYRSKPPTKWNTQMPNGIKTYHIVDSDQSPDILHWIQGASRPYCDQCIFGTDCADTHTARLACNAPHRTKCPKQWPRARRTTNYGTQLLPSQIAHMRNASINPYIDVEPRTLPICIKWTPAAGI